MSESNSGPAGPRFSKARKLVVLVDMRGAARLLGAMSDLEQAEFLHRFYESCTRHLEGRGGRVVKYLGDSALALFEEDAVVEAVDAVQQLRTEFREACRARGRESDVRCNMHAGEVVLGRFGPQGFSDVVGATVNVTFTLSASPGVNVSERVYRKLPNHRRSGWERRKPPVTYSLEAGS